MSKSQKRENPVYSTQTIEFVAVAKTYCDLMDQVETLDKESFLETANKLLPLLYAKALSLPDTELHSEEEPETFATEDQYGALAQSIATLLGNDDVYLEVFHEDMNRSDTPVAAFISENLSDIWQDLFNFISVFRLGYDETMNDALFNCKQNFGAYWGQSLVNVLRALHSCRFKTGSDDVFDDETEEDPWISL